MVPRNSEVLFPSRSTLQIVPVDRSPEDKDDSKKAIRSPCGEKRGEPIPVSDLKRTLPSGNSSVPRSRTIARPRPSGDQSAPLTLETSSRGAPPGKESRASVPTPRVARPQPQSELPRGGDRKQPCVAEAQRTPLGVAGTREIHVVCPAAPVRAVEDVPIGSEPGLVKGTLAECQLLEAEAWRPCA